MFLFVLYMKLNPAVKFPPYRFAISAKGRSPPKCIPTNGAAMGSMLSFCAEQIPTEKMKIMRISFFNSFAVKIGKKTQAETLFL